MFLQFLKYNTVGIVNTIVGFSIIMLLMLSGVSPLLSNGIGYGVGALLSYYLNSRYTFKAQTKSVLLATKFFLVLLLAYFLNVITLHSLLTSLNPYFAQFAAALVYTTSAFILSAFFVFNSTFVKESK